MLIDSYFGMGDSVLQQTPSCSRRFKYLQRHTGKVKPGTRDVYRWHPETRDPKIFRWDPWPMRWNPRPGTSNFLYFPSFILHFVLYTSLVTKLCINLFIRLTKQIISWRIYRNSHYDVLQISKNYKQLLNL